MSSYPEITLGADGQIGFTVEVGDTVTIGDGKVHWVVQMLGPTTALLQSGMTGRWRRRVPIKDLRIHTKGEKHG